MPIYEYRCNECRHELEALQSLSDPKLTDCPECGQPALKRLVSAVGFRLKGGGWYETDFKSGNKRNVAGEGGEAKSNGNGSGEGASKPAEAKGSGESKGGGSTGGSEKKSSGSTSSATTS